MYFYKKWISENWSNKGANFLYSFPKDSVQSNSYINKDWGDWLEKDQYENIKNLQFSILGKHLVDSIEIPPFISNLSNLESLSLPIDLFASLQDQINLELKNLNLFKRYSRQEDIAWKNNLRFLNLEAISVPELLNPFKIPIDCIPNISWLNYDLSVYRNTKILDELAQLEKVENLYFSYGKSFDIFTPFQERNVKTIDLWAFLSKNFPINNIIKLNNLVGIKINNIKSILDCSIFLELSNLEELYIFNVHDIVNVDKLLLHPKLRKLEVLSCKNPFKKYGGKELFYSRGFEYLNIDYA